MNIPAKNRLDLLAIAISTHINSQSQNQLKNHHFPILIHINPYESQLFIVNPLTALVNFDPPPDLGSATGAGSATAGISGRDARRDGTVDGGNGDGNGGEGG